MKKIQVTKGAGIETTDENEKNMFMQLVSRYLPYWPLFLALGLLGGGVGYYYTKTIVPVYEISASILIKDEKKGTDESKIMESFDLLNAKKIVENEIEVIHSRTILTAVIKDLHLYAPVFEKDRFALKPAYTSSPVLFEVLYPDSLVATQPIPFSFSPDSQIVLISNQQYPLNQWLKSKWGEIRFFNNPAYKKVAGAHSYYLQMITVKKAVNELSTRLEVSAPGKLSSVINLVLKDAVPERGEAIVNDVIDEYNRVSITDKNQLAANTLEFIEKRLRNMGKQLDSMEMGIQKFRTDRDVVDISAQNQQYLDIVANNDKKLSEANMQIAVLDEVEKYVASNKNETSIVPSYFAVGDRLLSNLIEKLYDTEVKYQGLRKTTAENNPILLSLRNEIDQMKPTILENIKNQRRMLEAGRDNLNSNGEKYSSLLRTMPMKERQLLEISRQQVIKNNIYSFLLQKREETTLSLNSTVSDSRLIDKAVSSISPVWPNSMLILGISVFGATLLGFFWIGLKEMMNKKLLFRSEIESMTMIPVIGELVYNKTKKPIVIKSGEKSLIAEQFRFLRATVSKSGTAKVKKIMITSSIQGEGKSFVAANLAASIALGGKKVVLVDLDLHKPGIHQLFNIPNEKGVSDFLAGNAEPGEFIVNTPENNNLYLMPAGPVPEDPSELLLNGKLKELFTYLESAFDMIIIDMAPALSISDAYIIGSRCDTNIYVIRHNYTPKVHVQLLDENTGMYKMKNIGIVFNGVKKRGAGKYGFGVGYGYNFDYGYGYTNKKNAERVR
jgi:tyrosine-protein kinase Etk/Wzc